MARPPKEIDWKVVEQKMQAGNTAKKIAQDLYIDTDTLYDRFKKEYGKSFSVISADFYTAGNQNIEYMQYMKAMSGDSKMLLWLGKVRLGQKEPDTTSQQYTNIIVKANDRLRSGVRIQSEGLSDTSNSSSEFGDEESGSCMASSIR